MYKLSPSSLNLFLDCKRCFWLHFNGHKRPSGIFPSLPSGMDKVLKEYCLKLRKKGKMLPALKGKGFKFFSSPLMKDWQNNFRGIQWKNEKLDVFLRGAVDEMLIKDGKLVVLDFKTRGYPCKEDTHKHYVLQINMYNLLLRKNNFKTADYGYLLFYYPKHVLAGNKIEFNTELKKMKVDVKMAESVLEKALKCLKGKEPKDEHECHWCLWNGNLEG